MGDRAKASQQAPASGGNRTIGNFGHRLDTGNSGHSLHKSNNSAEIADALTISNR